MEIILWVLLWILAGFLGLMILITLFYTVNALLVNPNKEYTTHSRYYRTILNIATAGCMKVARIRIHTTGMDKIPKDSRFLLICNHRSNFDPIVTWHIFSKSQLAFISKGQNFKVPFFGKIIRRCCFLEIDRENPRNAIKTIVKAADLIKRDEVSMAVYPEGTRSRDLTLLPFHDGVLKIAQKSNVPVVVTTIQGAENICKNFPLRGTDVYFDVLYVVSAEETKNTRTNILSDNARNKMEENISNNSKRDKK